MVNKLGQYERSMTFPDDRTVGTLFLNDLLYRYVSDEFAEARGRVLIPKGMHLIMTKVNKKASSDLSFLDAIGPYDLQSLEIEDYVTDPRIGPYSHVDTQGKGARLAKADHKDRAEEGGKRVARGQ